MVRSTPALTDEQKIDDLWYDLNILGFKDMRRCCIRDLAALRGSIEAVITTTEVQLILMDGVGKKTMREIKDLVTSVRFRQNILDAKLQGVLRTSVSDKFIQKAINERRGMSERKRQALGITASPRSMVDAIMLRKDIYEKHGMPDYKTIGSAGIDLRACIDESIVLAPGEVKMIGSGLKIHVQDPNYAAILLPRSGLGAKHGIVLGNLVGLIDSDYQGEMGMSIWNRSDKEYLIEPGDRIAQLVVIKVEQIVLSWVDKFESTERGSAGFGSTGV